MGVSQLQSGPGVSETVGVGNHKVLFTIVQPKSVLGTPQITMIKSTCSFYSHLVVWCVCKS